MSHPIAGPGTSWVRIRGTNEYRIFFNEQIDPKLYEVVSGPDQPSLDTKPEPVVEPPKPIDELASMSAEDLKKLPEYQALASKNFRNKDEVIKAIQAARKSKE